MRTAWRFVRLEALVAITGCLLVAGCEVGTERAEPTTGSVQGQINVMGGDCRCHSSHGDCVMPLGDADSCQDACGVFGVQGEDNASDLPEDGGTTCDMVFSSCRCGNDDDYICYVDRVNGDYRSCSDLCDLYTTVPGSRPAYSMPSGAETCENMFGMAGECQLERTQCIADCNGRPDLDACLEGCLATFEDCIAPSVSVSTCDQLRQDTQELVDFCEENCNPAPYDEFYEEPCARNSTQIEANRRALFESCADRSISNPCSGQADNTFELSETEHHPIGLYLDIFRDAYISGGFSVSVGSGTVNTSTQQSANLTCVLVHPHGADWVLNPDTGRIEPRPGTTPQDQYWVELVCYITMVYVANATGVDASGGYIVTVGAGTSGGIGVAQEVPPAYLVPFHHSVLLNAGDPYDDTVGNNPSSTPRLDPTFIPDLKAALEEMLERAAVGVEADLNLLMPEPETESDDPMWDSMMDHPEYWM